MRSAAHEREDVPPEPPLELAAEADYLRAGGAALGDPELGSRLGALISQLEREPGNGAVLAELRRGVSEMAYLGIRGAERTAALAANTAALRTYTAGRDAVETAIAAGIARGEAMAEARMKGAKGRHASPRKFGLRVVEGIAIAAVALKPLAGAAHHPVRSLLTASPGMKVAAAGTAATLAIVGTTAAVVPHVSLTDPFGTSTATPNPAASAYSATPIGSSPSSLRLAGSVTKPKPGLDAKGASANPLASLGLLPSLDVPSSSSSWPSQQASQQQFQVPANSGPAVLSVSTSSLDLSGGLTSVTVTLTASGSGWVAWKVTTDGSDLDFSSTHGVLNAGQSATFTVTLASVLDAAQMQVFTVGGEQFTVTLPVPPVPVPVVSDVPSLLPLPSDTSSASGN